MSHDEIVFDTVQYREPERRVRPDRDLRWACVAYEVPHPIDLPIYLERATADAIERHALRDTSVELGGILLGKECIDEQTGLPFVLVTKSLEAKHYENTQASFTYTHDSWEEITRERDRLHPDLDIVGWYHTHPDFGIFLSGHDLFIHRNFFAQSLQVAYVVDPIRQTRGFFQWRDGDLAQVGGYFFIADRRDRIALARFANDLENIPNPEGGGGLSPRLEAELIAMLTRPSSSMHSSANLRGQSAALFSLGGAVVGMALVFGMLWLYTLHNQIQQQTETLKHLEQQSYDSNAGQSLAFKTLLDDKQGTSSQRLIAAYDQMKRERDTSQLEVDRWRTANEAMSDKTLSLLSDNAKMKKELEASKKDTEEYRRIKKDSADLPTRIAELSVDLEKKESEVARLSEVLKATDSKGAEELVAKYHKTWYVALSGWIVAIAMALGLLALLTQSKLFDDPDIAAPPGPVPSDGPTHRIV
ncbi:Mov34/MPN/PAD-1 family protein [Singulisphaera sp. PoT]|uniref:Mov34/MPN/PAD-1 family protein n=1 Tax=Singulisphaera sp. PoT TaxID=3411797 RepID=UPI003BF50D02